jgi:hypothetical protein
MGAKGQPKTGGRQKGSKNKLVADFKQTKGISKKLAELDASGMSMAEIQVEMARWLRALAASEREKNTDAAARYGSMASKIAKDVSPFLYPTHSSIKHSGEEDGAPIRIETLSDYQLERLIERLRKS